MTSCYDLLVDKYANFRTFLKDNLVGDEHQVVMAALPSVANAMVFLVGLKQMCTPEMRDALTDVFTRWPDGPRGEEGNFRDCAEAISKQLPFIRIDQSKYAVPQIFRLMRYIYLFLTIADDML